MQKEYTEFNPTANEKDRFGITWTHIVVLLTTPLLAIMVYWLTLPQGAPIAGALAVTIFAAVCGSPKYCHCRALCSVGLTDNYLRG
jgi:bacteriorhodopsin